MATQQILSDADAALDAALDDTAECGARHDAMTSFMKAFEKLAQEVANGTATWDGVRPWGQRNARRFYEAQRALNDWQARLARLSDGNEEEIEWSLYRRSQHAFAREVFAGTEADELLATYESAEGDAELHDSAERSALYHPSYAPRTHTWWYWDPDR